MKRWGLLAWIAIAASMVLLSDWARSDGRSADRLDREKLVVAAKKLRDMEERQDWEVRQYWVSPSKDAEIYGKNIELLKSASERAALHLILSDFHNLSYDQLLELGLADDICQSIECGAAPPETVKRYLESYFTTRIAEDNHDAAVRSAAAAERNSFVAVASATISLFALAISILSFRHAISAAKRVLPV